MLDVLYRNNVSRFDVEAGEVVVVAVILQRSHLHGSGCVCNAQVKLSRVSLMKGSSRQSRRGFSISYQSKSAFHPECYHFPLLSFQKPKRSEKTHTTTSINAFTNHPEKSFSTTLVGNDQISLTRISSLITVQAIRRDRKKTKKDFHFVVTSLHPSSVKFAFESSPLRSCLISRLACVVVNWFTMSSAV